MKKKIWVALVALILTASVAGLPRYAVNATTAVGVLSYLPASDAIMVVDVRRLLTQTVPKIFSGDLSRIAQANAEIEKFKARTGIDPRSFDRVVIGTRFTYPSPKTTKLETVAIAQGAFNAKEIAASVRTAAGTGYREEKYHGATIMLVNINDQMKVLGLWDMQVKELGVCVLDPNSLALGDLEKVRAAIDAGKKGRANAELAALATRDPNAVMGFGANIPRELLATLNVGNDTIAKDVNSIRQAYGSVGSTQTDVSVMLVARTDSPESAQNLSDTVTGLKQLGGFLVGQLKEPRKTLAQNALDNLKITTRGVELEIRTQVAAASLASLIK